MPIDLNGSKPNEFSVDDAKRVARNAAIAAALAALGYLSENLTGIHVSGFYATLLPFAVAGVNTLIRYFTDTRV